MVKNYNDPNNHPLRRFPGNLYVIDLGSRFKPENRYRFARGDAGSDGLPHAIGHIASMDGHSGYDSYSRASDIGERLLKALEKGDGMSVRVYNRTVFVRRVR